MAVFDRCSLYLQPAQHDYCIENIESLLNTLRDIKLIAGSIASNKNHAYYSGANYLDHIAYMGCAPTIRFETDDDSDNFCHLAIHSYDSPRLIHSQKQARPPHCPGCSQAVKNWQQNRTDDSIYCDSCGTTSGIERFDWRKMGGYAQLFIEITDIFPKEAIPQQSLLDRLASATGTEWRYFYSCA